MSSRVSSLTSGNTSVPTPSSSIWGHRMITVLKYTIIGSGLLLGLYLLKRYATSNSANNLAQRNIIPVTSPTADIPKSIPYRTRLNETPPSCFNERTEFPFKDYAYGIFKIDPTVIKARPSTELRIEGIYKDQVFFDQYEILGDTPITVVMPNIPYKEEMRLRVIKQDSEEIVLETRLFPVEYRQNIYEFYKEIELMTENH
ncbi:MAG TPA: hypothetical protein VHA52_07450, partial [Candidatus Babeliaceae bacterium]|nr:hypothetical protein [Candidatus Babeliaceae bacterium]